MTKLAANEHPESRALEDAAWNLKDLAADTNARVMSAPLRSALQRATRDVQRVYDGLHAELHKRKRDRADEPESPNSNGAANDQQQPLLGEVRNDG